MAMDTATIQRGWGYHETFNGNLTGSFKRAKEDIAVEVLELHYGNQYDAVLVKLPNGNTGLVDIRSFSEERN